MSDIEIKQYGQAITVDGFEHPMPECLKQAYTEAMLRSIQPLRYFHVEPIPRWQRLRFSMEDKLYRVRDAWLVLTGKASIGEDLVIKV